MPVLRKTEDFQAVKTRALAFQYPNGEYPVVRGIATVYDEYGNVGFMQDICANSVSLMGGGGEITLTTDGVQLLVDGIPVGGGGGGGVAQILAGTGITAAPATGNVLVSNSGVLSVNAGTGISVSATTGDITISTTGGPSITILGENGVEVSDIGAGQYRIGAVWNRDLAFFGDVSTDPSFNTPTMVATMPPSVWPFRNASTSTYIVEVSIAGNLPASIGPIPNAFFYSVRFDASGSSAFPVLDTSSNFYRFAPVMRVNTVNYTSYFSGMFQASITLPSTEFVQPNTFSVSLFLQPVPFDRSPIEMYTIAGGAATVSLRPYY